MEVKQGQIILRPPAKPRAGWAEQIARVIATDPRASTADDELTDWEATAADGLDEAN